MRRRRQFSIAALMTLVLCSAVVLALVRDPDIRAALLGLAFAGLLFVVLVSVVYFFVGCVLFTSVGCIPSNRPWNPRLAFLERPAGWRT